jgi:hypothetical protein
VHLLSRCNIACRRRHLLKLDNCERRPQIRYYFGRSFPMLGLCSELNHPALWRTIISLLQFIFGGGIQVVQLPFAGTTLPERLRMRVQLSDFFEDVFHSGCL